MPDSPLSGLKVVIVDDSKTIRRNAELLLSKEGCDVVVANDGFLALDVIMSANPDIVFLDVMMPRLDGFQTCQMIKRSKQLQHAKVIMLSSKDGVFDVARGRMSGADHYMTKPFSKEELISAINVARS